MGGPSVSLTDAPYSNRRAVYGYIERQNLPAFFRTFDFANPNTHSPERPQTTAPQQALFFMNSPFAIEQAVHLAARSEAEVKQQAVVPGVAPQVSPQGSVVAGSPDPATVGVRGQETRAQRSGARHSLDPSHLNAAANRVRRISRLFRDALGREPAIDEVADALAFVDVGDSPKIGAVARQLSWQFGWGTCDDATGAVTFNPLPAFINKQWQGSDKWPDQTLGWAMLSATGGHPGDAAHAVIRRWIAPRAGTLNIEGVLAHEPTQGEGVRCRVSVKGKGVVGTWQAHHSEVATHAANIALAAGDSVDFVTDCGATLDHDQFNWTVTLRLGAANDAGEVWDSASGFHGPLELPLTRWQQLAQVLLMSNEFAFVD
jgi:hypothetical protein